jgi:hypothetical protein
MCAVDAPVLRHGKVLGKVQEQIVTGHGTTGEKVVTHPTLIKVVRVVFMGENMHKELAAGFQKVLDLVQELLGILHVLKHFHRHDQVVALHGI